jgi:hypothetical protein
MRGMLAVLERELTEWRLVFLVALITGLIPLAAPWLPSPGGLDPAEMRDAGALVLALILTAVLAFMMGSSVLARDLSERRLGFYFARPLSGAAIWAGKMLGSLILAVGAGLLVLLPTLVAGGDIAPAPRLGGPDTIGSNLAILLVPVLGVLLLLVTAHAVAVMVRSRAPWLALDAAALALVGLAFWSCRRTLVSEGAIGPASLLQTVLIGGFLVAASVAGLVQVVHGRTDLRRGHRFLSSTLWLFLGVLALGGILYTRWVFAVTPRDLVSFHTVLPAPAGSWIAVGGTAAGRQGYEPTFLLDLASGRFLRLESFVHDFRLPAFSRDGSRAVWLSRPAASREYGLWTLDLSRSGARPVRTNVSYETLPQLLVLSPDGSRVAARLYERLTVDDLRTGRLLFSALIPPDPEFRDRLRFADRDHLRIFESFQVEEPGRPPVWRLRAVDLDLATRRRAPVAQVDVPGHEGLWSLSPDGTRALLRRNPLQERLLIDLRTGRTVRLTQSDDPFAATFLADGRLVLINEEGDQVTLRFLSPEATEQLRVRVPGYRIRVGGQPTPHLLAVATRPLGKSEPGSWTSWLIDLRTGRVRRLANGLVPTVLGFREPGSLGSRLFYRGRGDLLLLDPATGKLQTVLPGTDSPSNTVQIFRR